MERINTPNGIFTDHTPPTSHWLNQVQDEICDVIAAAKLPLDQGDTTQLLKAIIALHAMGPMPAMLSDTVEE